jgi:DNA-binding NarL/FixJ family response regulator
MPRILIVEKDAAVGAALCDILRAEISAEIAYVGSANEALELLRDPQWDLVLLSSRTPNVALVPLERIVLAHPNRPVLVIGVLPEPPDARNLLAAGARGYLCAGAVADELTSAVRVVLGGRRYVDLSLVAAMAADLQQIEDQPLHTRLSAREFQIFCKIARGQTVSYIAEELCLSVKTVSTYRARIMEKTNFRTNADITAYALKARLMDVEQEPVR